MRAIAGCLDMVSKKPAGIPTPRTLMEAHELLVGQRPGSDASAESWLRYYRRSAAMYVELAEVDRGHHHEARYWANRESARADAIAAEIARKPRTSKEIAETATPDGTVHKEQI